MKLEFFPELCCDYCNSIIHNHFDCPNCKQSFAETGCYYDLSDYVDDLHSGKELVMCLCCRAEFKWVSGDNIYESEWEMVDNGKNASDKK